MIKRIWICTIVLFLAVTGMTGQIIGPYLQSPTDTSMWITWKTNSGMESKVIYGSDSLSMQSQVTGACEVLSDAGYDHNYFYHSVRLTGLIPDSFYYYRVITGSLQSAAFRFRTQPKKGINQGIYRFLVLGDHQIKDTDNYQSLMKAAREKVIDKYGGRMEENINLIINNGDQVDEGTLDQYEHVHFKPSAILSGNIPIMTTVGNHEFYGSMGISSYYPHFFYDELGYKGIISPGGENYYSYQQGSIVFIHLSSEHPNDEQITWVQQVVDSVMSDPSVKWLVSIAHKPIQAEQFVGDMSYYVREKIIPILAQTEKSTLFIAGHHHLYARGQVRDFPIYHIISGAASWDQFWGQSVEKDFDDVQKTIDFWTYQIVTFDDSKNEMNVESYAIGSPKLGLTIKNELIDSFYRKPGGIPPSEPTIITIPADSVSLPFTFVSSPYVTLSIEPYNSTQFQVSSDSFFINPYIDRIRDFENLYGTSGNPDYLPVDIHSDLNIFEYEIGKNKLPDGTYYIRTRHRDRNIEWSEWSGFVEFRIKGSVPGFTSMFLQSSVFLPEEEIAVEYRFGPGNEKDWIGIYKSGDIPGLTPSTDWDYVNGSSGTVNLRISQAGHYFIAFFENDGYDELSERLQLYVREIPDLILGKAGYAVGEGIQVSYSNAPGLPNDWIGIYRLNETPGLVGSTLWKYTSSSTGVLDFSGLPAGYYFITYFLEDGYAEACERVIFSVGSELATLYTDQLSYFSGQPILVNFENGPGTAKDWIGLFREKAPPGTAPLVFRQFIGNQTSGSVSFEINLDAGDYYFAMCINNTGIRISGKAIFTIESNASSVELKSVFDEITLFPSPTSGSLRLKTKNLQNSDICLKISSYAGKTIFEDQVKASYSFFSGEIDLSGVPEGIYIVSLLSGEEICTKKLVIN